LPRVNSATEESQPVHCKKEMLHGVYTEYGECVQHDKPIFEIASSRPKVGNQGEIRFFTLIKSTGRSILGTETI